MQQLPPKRTSSQSEAAVDAFDLDVVDDDAQDSQGVLEAINSKVRADVFDLEVVDDDEQAARVQL